MKNKTVLLFDDGMNTWMAERLTRDFSRVLIHTPWSSDYPRSQDDRIGEGIEGVERVSDIWGILDEVDLFIFLGLYHGGLQEHLVSLGKRVWGSKHGDLLERDRWGSYQKLQKLDIPTPEMTRIKGIGKLREFLKENEDVYIKVSEYRGDFETFHSVKYELTKPILDELEHRLGLVGDNYEFIVCLPIDGDDVVEFGYDGWSIDGKFPSETIVGFEHKDVSYVCGVKPASKLSPLVTDFCEKISPTLKRLQYRNFIHTEGRTGKEKIPRIIDLSQRIGSPPGEILCEMLTNLGDIFWYGAEGELIEPKWEGKFGVQMFVDSSWSDDKFQAVHFPDKIKRWVKLRNYCIQDGTYYVIPKYRHFDNVGSVVAVGNSIDECIEKVNKYAKEISGYKIEIPTASADKLKEIISKAKSIGISI